MKLRNGAQEKTKHAAFGRRENILNIFTLIQAIIISILAMECSPPSRLIPDGTYDLNYSYVTNDTTKMIPGPDNYFVIKGDSVFYYEFEPYIKPKTGLISGNYFIFDSKDKARFKLITSGFTVTEDSISTIYRKK